MIVYIGMGSNIEPEKNLRATAAMLKILWPDIRFSSVWRSRARDVEDQPDFLNAVASFDSTQAFYRTFDQLLSVEKGLKKEIKFRCGPRTIDLDVLLVSPTPSPSPDGGGETSSPCPLRGKGVGG